MSAAILYHVQGIRKHFLRKISIKKGIFIFECFWRHPEELKCAGCGSGNVRRKGTKMRIFTGVPMGNMRTRIHAEIPRVHCLDCGKVAQIHIDFARPNVLPRTCRRRIRKRSGRIFRILSLSATDFISCRCCIGRSRTVDARSIANYRTKPPAEPLREADLFC